MVQEQKIIEFMSFRYWATAFSCVMVLGAIGSLVFNGIKFGLDFTGGTQIEVGFERTADLTKVRNILVEEGLTSPVAVLFGSEREVLIRTQDAMSDAGERQIRERLAALDPEAALLEVGPGPREQETYTQRFRFEGVSRQQLEASAIFSSDYFGLISYQTQGTAVDVLVEQPLDRAYIRQLLNKLGTETGMEVELRRSEFVGPQIGEELRDEGGLGILFALIVVMIYVGIRFQYKFAVSAVVSLILNVIVVVGILSIMQRDFDLTVLAAVLAVIGYSINDTIVIFDRIRDNFRILRKSSAEEVINISLTQTLERTLLTSLTTLLTLVMLYVYGGELINGFSFTLIVGIIAGTYSSIYVACTILLSMEITKEDLMPTPIKAEGAEFDEVP